MKKFDRVDHVMDHQLSDCSIYKSFELEQVGCKSSQILDIPPVKMEVAEHRYYEYKCKCRGQKSIDKGIKELNQDIQYGRRIKALVTYLNVNQLIPYKRLVQLVNNLFNQRISEESISNFTEQLSGDLGEFKVSSKKILQHLTK